MNEKNDLQSLFFFHQKSSLDKFEGIILTIQLLNEEKEILLIEDDTFLVLEDFVPLESVFNLLLEVIQFIQMAIFQSNRNF